MRYFCFVQFNFKDIFLASAIIIFFALISMHSSSCRNGEQENDSLLIPYLNDPAIKAITEKINEDRDNPELYFQRAQEFMRMQKVLPAYKDIEQAITLDPENKNYLFFKADMMLSDGYAEGAKESLVKILAIDPYDMIAITKLAKVYLYAKDYENSLIQVKKLIDKDKSNFEPYFIAGLNYKEIKDTAKAIEQFKVSLQFKPDFYDAYMQLGLLASAQKSPLADQYFDNAIRLDSTVPESYYAKAKFYQDSKRYKEAKQIYNQLIRVSPQNANAFFNIGFIYIMEDSIARAKKYFNYAVQVNPIYADAYYYRALCEYELGEIVLAKSDLTQCLALDPDNDKAQNLFNTLNKQ
jgi:tetratricopeptide (TPR) repeat protein